LLQEIKDKKREAKYIYRKEGRKIRMKDMADPNRKGRF
jgi:hypothetical protein